MRSAKILSAVLLISLAAGCMTTQPPRPTQPPAPILAGMTDHPADPDGLCLDARSLADLLLYIERLKEGYE